MKNTSDEPLSGEVILPDEQLPASPPTILLKDLKAETRIFAVNIEKNWRLAVKSVLATCSEISQARSSLQNDPAERQKLDLYLANNLGISSSERSKLEIIGRNPVFRQARNEDSLPVAISTLYKLTMLPEEELQAALDDHKITPSTTLTEVNQKFFVPKAKKQNNGGPKKQGDALTVTLTSPSKSLPEDLLEELNAVLDKLNIHIPVQRSGF